MPANVGFAYEKAEEAYHKAQTPVEKIRALQNMLSSLAKHKGNEKLQMEIKQKISKLKGLQERERKTKKGSSLVIKREGAARVTLIGKTQAGRSYLLSKLTNAKPLIADYEFTTKKPEIGSMDYEGIKIQIIEIPAITKDFIETEKGPSYFGIVRESELVIILANNKEDEKFVKHELKEAGINFNGLVINSRREDPEEIKEEIWKMLNLIYVYTKTPGKEKDFPPVALKKGAIVKDLAMKVHKDFIRKFNYARVNGKSAKFENQQVGLNHKLQSGDVVELHLK